jgi:hypothetical protein
VIAPLAKIFCALRARLFLTALGPMPAQTRTKGLILWTPSIVPDGAPPSTSGDYLFTIRPQAPIQLQRIGRSEESTETKALSDSIAVLTYVPGQ